MCKRCWAGGAEAVPRLPGQGQEVLFPAEHDGRGRPIPRPESWGVLRPGLALWLSALRFLEKPGVPAPAVLEGIYTPAVFAFQARLQCPAFGFTGGRFDLHTTSGTLVERTPPGKPLCREAEQ